MHDDLELGTRDKVVTKMTRDGAVEDNLSKGTSTRVSARAEDADFEFGSGDSSGSEEAAVYTIKATAEYSDESTTKVIYVGENSQIIKAYNKTGKSIDEIKQEVSKGAEINDEGELIYFEIAEESESTPKSELIIENEESYSKTLWFVFIGAVIVISTVGIVLLYRLRKKQR